MILADKGRWALTEAELDKCGSITMPHAMSKPGRQYTHTQLGLLEYVEKQGNYWILKPFTKMW